MDNYNFDDEQLRAYNNESRPYMTAILVIVNIVAFIYLEIKGDTQDAGYMLNHGAMFPEAVIENNEYWRFFTSMFMHFGMEHIMNNMFILACSGYILEEAIGHVKYLILYILSGIGASWLSFHMMVKTGEYAVSAGASGAIFGIIGGLLWIVIVNKGHYEKLTGKGLIFMIILIFYYGITEGNVDNWDHLGGLICGFVLCIIMWLVNLVFKGKGNQ